MEDEGYQLKSAILVYNNVSSCGTHNHYFQAHDVALVKGRPELMEGRPLTMEALTNLCRAVLPSLFNDRLSYIDNKVLAASGASLGPDVWWVAPAVRPMFFASAMRVKNGPAPWPGLVIVACRGKMEIFAVKGKRRPSLNTKLYMAPLLNMGQGNAICLGNAVRPIRNNDYNAWEDALFNSAFSEDHVVQRIKEGSLKLLWRRLIRGGARTFPEEQFLPCREYRTLKSLLDALKGDENGYGD